MSHSLAMAQELFGDNSQAAAWVLRQRATLHFSVLGDAKSALADAAAAVAIHKQRIAAGLGDQRCSPAQTFGAQQFGTSGEEYVAAEVELGRLIAWHGGCVHVSWPLTVVVALLLGYLLCLPALGAVCNSLFSCCTLFGV